MNAFPSSKGPNTYEKLNREIWNLSARKTTTEPKEFNNTSIMIVDPININDDESSLSKQK